MTEKRFTFTQDTLAKADVFDGSEFVCCTLSIWVEQLVDLLNQLNDENEQLKSYTGEMEDYLARLEEKNEQLKHDATVLIQANQDYRRENEQLKQQIQQLQHWNNCLGEKRHQELSYKPYTASKSEKELKELLEPKLFNCSDR